jgi:alkylated DNA repair dioxygenase AlkB
MVARTLGFMAAVKFARPDELPQGFSYREEFLNAAEEAELLRIFGGVEFEAYDYHGYLAKRRIVRYGVSYDLSSGQENDHVPAIPEFLLGIRERAGEFAGIPPDELVQAMVSEYSVGTAIGWHRDAPQFGSIIGISLGSACRMRLKPYQAPGSRALHDLRAEGGRAQTKILSLRLEPRSIYAMRGPARSEWQHSIPAVDEMRYSITFRTLRPRGRTQGS